MMETRIDFLSGIASRAAGTPPYEPACISQIEASDPVTGMQYLRNALALELPFTTNYLPLSNEDKKNAYGLFQWLRSQLVQASIGHCSGSSTPITQVLQVASALDVGPGQLWRELASAGQLRVDRLREIGFFLQEKKMVIKPGRHMAQVTATFQESCNKHDWESVDRVLIHVLGFYDAVLASATRALAVFSPHSLNATFSRMKDVTAIFAAIESVEHIPDFNILELAVTSSSWPLKFFSVRLSLENERVEISDELDDARESLLIQASRNVEEWPKWVAVFNSYPSRFPKLQRPMAAAMASMSKQAVAQYFAAIRMSTAHRRDDLATVFEEISRQPNEVQRKLIWTHAYERWKAWDYERADSAQNLLSVQESLLDLAVAAFYRECMSSAESKACEDKLREEFFEIKDAWYEDISAYKTAMNRHLSHYQPLGHALHNLCANQDWTEGKCWYRPDWIPDHPYWNMRYR